MNRSSASYELVRAYAPEVARKTASFARASPRASSAAKSRSWASRRVPVLIVGETGTGKTLLAQELRSVQQGGRDMAVNCASLSEAQLAQFVLEHLKLDGDAGGTLFLDEIGELSPWGQAVLLRALSDRDPSRGPRLVAATSRDLEALVRTGGFSGELLMRLRGVTLQLPPLRERVEEIGPLALHFVRVALMSTRSPVVSMDPRVVSALEHHGWPGNARELRNTMLAALAQCSDGYLCIEGLPEELRSAHATARE